MRRFVIWLIFFASCSGIALGASFGSASVALSDLTQLGKQWYLRGESQPFTGIATSYYEGGEKKAEIQFRDGLRHGKETGWYPNGKLRHIVRYRKGEPQGLGSSWFSQAQAKPEPLSFVLCSEHPELVSVCGEADQTEPSRFEFCGEGRC